LVPSVLSVLLLTGAAGARAEEMTAEAFERFAEGRTLYFTRDGAPFGAEQYFPARRSLWQYADGTCAAGVWWAAAGGICFRYEERSDTQCWRFDDRPDGFAAELVEGGAGTGFVLELSRRDDTPLPCPGPRVGS